MKQILFLGIVVACTSGLYGMLPYQLGSFERMKPGLAVVMVQAAKKTAVEAKGELSQELKKQKLEAIKRYIEPFTTTAPYKKLMEQAASDLDLSSFIPLVNQAVKEELVYNAFLKQQLQGFNATEITRRDLEEATPNIIPAKEESSWWGEWFVSRLQPQLPRVMPQAFLTSKYDYIRTYLVNKGFQKYQENPPSFIDALNSTFKQAHPLFFNFLEVYLQTISQKDIQHIIQAIVQEVPEKKQAFLKTIKSEQFALSRPENLTQSFYTYYPEAKVFGEKIQQEDLTEFSKTKTIEERFPGLRDKREKALQTYIQQHENDARQILTDLDWLALTVEPAAIFQKRSYAAQKEGNEKRIEDFKRAILSTIKTTAPQLYNDMQNAQLTAISSEELKNLIKSVTPLTIVERASHLVQQIKHQAAPTLEKTYEYAHKTAEQAADYATRALQTGWNWLTGLVEETPQQKMAQKESKKLALAQPAAIVVVSPAKEKIISPKSTQIEESKLLLALQESAPQKQEASAPIRETPAIQTRAPISALSFLPVKEERSLVNSLAEFNKKTKKQATAKQIFNNLIEEFLAPISIPGQLVSSALNSLVEVDRIRFKLHQKLIAASSILTQLQMEFLLPEDLNQPTLLQIETAKSAVCSKLVPENRESMLRVSDVKEFDKIAEPLLVKLRPVVELYQNLLLGIKKFVEEPR